ncbi:ABC transporter substrate-binding protein [Paenibacillus oceani]|uniref:Sugar ABC transporter substrate-binding protein n=1 Tax=Paenibacillus oceani TaxID=2772510 RepID=A0A927C7L5_9BACL|nr:sugar ABC transporter substrate-binding protein [Paenibacillus oceani]MBD2862680.1 sugar ABC transporter substrate-binding protein [Paenibacillus oceani]
MSACTLKVALIGGPAFEPLYKSFEAFTRQTGISIDIAFTGTHPSLNQHLMHAYEAGEGDYDLVSTHTKYAPSQLFLEPLNDDFEEAELADFVPGALSLATYEGKLLCIPRNVDIRLLFYRKDWLNEIRIDKPDTWEQLRHICEVLHERGIVGFAFTGKESGLFGTFYELLVSYGGRLFDDSLQPAFDSSAGIRAAAFLCDLYRSRFTPAEVPNMHYDEVSNAFRSGSCAMAADWPGYYGLYGNPETSRVSGLFDIGLLPCGPTGDRGVYAGSMSFGLPKGAPHKQEALRLLKYVTSADVQRIDLRNGHVPVRNSLMARLDDDARAGTLELKRLTLLRETLDRYMIIPPRFEAYPMAEDIIWGRIREALLGKLTPETAVTMAAAEIRGLKPAPR